MDVSQGKCDFCGDRTEVVTPEDTGAEAAICECCADDAIAAFMTAKSNRDAEADAGDDS